MLKPLYERIIIKHIEPSVKPTDGIQSPVNNDLPMATVIAVGCGRLKHDGTLVALIVKDGDTIYYDTKNRRPYGEYFIITENDVIGVEE